MKERIRAFDWARTPLGPIQDWPQSLRTVVNILLTSRYAMWMAWGPELTMLYNDAYQPTLGIKHPRALGTPASDVWEEIWPDIGPRIETVLTTGEATYDQGLMLFLERSGFPEETYHTFSYSPLEDDQGHISGMLCVVTEETDRIIGERRVETLRDVASALAATNTEDEVLAALQEKLSVNQKDLPFTLTYLFDDEAARLAASSGISAGHHPAVSSISRDSDNPWPAHGVFAHPSPRLIDLGVERDINVLPAGFWNKPPQQAVVVPIRQQGQDDPAGFFVLGINPYRRYDSAYSGFVDLLTGQVAAGLGNARAYEAERQRAEVLAELDHAKTTFFSNVSHELRTPLTLMLSPVEELLSAGRARDNGERQQLELVHRNGLRLQKLVNALLDFSRIEAGRMQASYSPVNLARLTEDLASNFRSAMERSGLKFDIRCDALDEPVYVDQEMWEKIVLNLVSNALKFTFDGGVRVELKRSGDDAVLIVSDTGIGIPEPELPRIFERFHRVEGSAGRTIEGTGIGLALVHELVKLHGGSIRVTSQAGAGCTFTVSIPMGAGHLPQNQIKEDWNPESISSGSITFVDEAVRWLPPGVEPSAVSSTTARERVLVADDNADMRDYITRLLSEHYDVVAVTNGLEAVESALADPPSLILSDVMMPKLNGFELVEALRESPATSTIPVILLSARAGEESRVEGLRHGADDYLVKPFTARELLARVGAHLAMRRRWEAAEAAQKLAESQLRRSNLELQRANQELEQFAYSASHDLQEPLRQVAIYSQLIQRVYSERLDDSGREYLAYCAEGARRMEMLVRDLLAYSRAGKVTGPASTVDINRVVKDVKANLAAAIEESDAVISTVDLPVVRIDAVPLTHLFQNLLSNALKYRGPLRPRITVSAKDQGSEWLFSVADNGIGISKEFQPQIFGIFKRLHTKDQYPGTGIGLAISQKVVQSYGGRIWVESEAGEGATFFFTLPKELEDPAIQTGSSAH